MAVEASPVVVPDRNLISISEVPKLASEMAVTRAVAASHREAARMSTDNARMLFVTSRMQGRLLPQNRIGGKCIEAFIHDLAAKDLDKEADELYQGDFTTALTSDPHTPLADPIRATVLDGQPTIREVHLSPTVRGRSIYDEWGETGTSLHKVVGRLAGFTAVAVTIEPLDGNRLGPRYLVPLIHPETHEPAVSLQLVAPLQ